MSCGLKITKSYPKSDRQADVVVVVVVGVDVVVFVVVVIIVVVANTIMGVGNTRSDSSSLGATRCCMYDE